MQRTKDMRDLISVWENFYAVLGLPHRKAREVALQALLGYDSHREGTIYGPGGDIYEGAEAEDLEMDVNSISPLGSPRLNIDGQDGQGSPAALGGGVQGQGQGNEGRPGWDNALENILRSVQHPSYPVLQVWT